MNRIFLLMLSLLLTSASLCADKPKLTEEAKALIKEAKAQTHPISEKEMRTKMKKGKIVLIDVRDPDEWSKGTIDYERQVKISRGFLEIKYPKLILEKYTKEDTFVVYCALEPRSVLAAKTLKQLGFKNVYYLEGGLKKLKKRSDCSKVSGPISIK